MQTAFIVAEPRYQPPGVEIGQKTIKFKETRLEIPANLQRKSIKIGAKNVRQNN
jgi:hypothetical protein